FTVLTMKRSILTEKISRRGFHLSREYAIDPLEILFVREVMRTNVIALPSDISRDDISHKIQMSRGIQHLYPVIGRYGQFEGLITRKDLDQVEEGTVNMAEAIKRRIITAFPDEPLRVVVNRMAETGRTRMPVVDRGDPLKLLGVISLSDLLRARTRNLEEERR